MIASGTMQKFGKLLIKKTRHTIVLALTSFPDAGKCPHLERKLHLTPHDSPAMSPPLDILLVEDERSVAFSILFALKCDGHRIQVVADGEQALASIDVEPDRFDLLITDHSMPGMAGIELVQQLRQESFRGKIMVLSAHLSPENRLAYEALAVNVMVSKPFDVHELRATITRLANGVAPVPGEKPFQLSRTALHNMLKTALIEEEETDNADHDVCEGRT